MSEQQERECTKVPCEHWEASGTGLGGHCSHALCPNYMDSCPVHENYGLRR